MSTPPSIAESVGYTECRNCGHRVQRLSDAAILHVAAEVFSGEKAFDDGYAAAERNHAKLFTYTMGLGWGCGMLFTLWVYWFAA